MRTRQFTSAHRSGPSSCRVDFATPFFTTCVDFVVDFAVDLAVDFSGVILFFISQGTGPQEIHRDSLYKNPCQNPRSKNEHSSRLVLCSPDNMGCASWRVQEELWSWQRDQIART